MNTYVIQLPGESHSAFKLRECSSRMHRERFIVDEKKYLGISTVNDSIALLHTFRKGIALLISLSITLAIYSWP